MNDHELLAGIKQKNESCYEMLVEKYMRYVAAIISRVAGRRLNNYDIEEISSETFIKIWMNSQKIVLKGESLKAYLAMSARNNTLNVLRDRQKRQEDVLNEELISSDSVEAYVMLEEENKDINETLSELPELEREILVRRYFNQEKIKDIAEKVGIDEKAVSARIGRSKNKLKMMLSKKGLL
ncbi:MAG: RNA polymerase subunit sigma-24 [Firmicutes bacterium HGW-Firmicutes-7]|nr:MAG: RNA polymerase subunit sigma-24 [Firmicutes bacterium HGW-Firmicutes-7]